MEGKINTVAVFDGFAAGTIAMCEEPKQIGPQQYEYNFTHHGQSGKRNVVAVTSSGAISSASLSFADPIDDANAMEGLKYPSLTVYPHSRHYVANPNPITDQIHVAPLREGRKCQRAKRRARYNRPA